MGALLIVHNIAVSCEKQEKVQITLSFPPSIGI